MLSQTIWNKECSHIQDFIVKGAADSAMTSSGQFLIIFYLDSTRLNFVQLGESLHNTI